MEELILITTAIYSIYKKLYSLELKGLKDSEEYTKNLEYLFMTLDIEKKLYEKLEIDSIKFLSFVYYLTAVYNIHDIKNDIDSKLLQSDENTIINRILHSLKSEVSIKREHGVLFITEYLEKFIGQHYGIDYDDLDEYGYDEEELENLEFNILQVFEAVKNETFNNFVLFLDENILNENYINIKDELLLAKYRTAFLRKGVEVQLFPDKPAILNLWDLNSKYMAKIMGISAINHKNLKKGFGINELRHQVLKIMDIKDEDYVDKNKQLIAALNHSYLKAAGLLIDDELLGRIFNRFIVKFEKEGSSPSDSISGRMIINAFEEAKGDKNKSITLVLERKLIKPKLKKRIDISLISLIKVIIKYL
jgi:hypothetical protein